MESGRRSSAWVLPLDAVEVYEDILVRIPSFAPAVQRAAAVRVLLENPAASARLTHDTTCGAPPRGAR